VLIGLHLIEIDELPLLQMYVHCVLGYNVTENCETLGYHFYVEFVVRVQFVHVVDVGVGDVTGLDDRWEKALYEIGDPEVETLHRLFKFIISKLPCELIAHIWYLTWWQLRLLLFKHAPVGVAEARLLLIFLC